MIPDFKNLSLLLNVAIFIASAILVWIAGARAAHYADRISQLTGVGQATIGLVLLAGVTSLPEIAVTITASIDGNAKLSVNNLLGGLPMVIAILALADLVVGRDALTSIIADPDILLQGTLNILLLAIVAMAIIVGDIPLLGIGGWSWSVLALYVASIWMIARYPRQQGWEATGVAPDKRNNEASPEKQEQNDEGGGGTLLDAIVKTIVVGTVILIGGFLLARTGDAIAVQTGLGASFVGAVFVAISTSLPEISSVLSAVRLRRYEMAVSDVFGTNLFSVALIFLADAMYRGGPVLAEVGGFSLLATMLGIVTTTLYLAGLIERRNLTVFRMGLDSVGALLVYAGGLVLLYRMR